VGLGCGCWAKEGDGEGEGDGDGDGDGDGKGLKRSVLYKNWWLGEDVMVDNSRVWR